MDHHSRLSHIKNRIKTINKTAFHDMLIGRGKAVLFSFTILISLLILVYLVYSQRQVLTSYNFSINPIFIFLFCVLYIFNFILVTFVWGQILVTFNVHADFVHHLRSYAISNLAKRIPGTIWYIPFRKQFYGNNIGITSKINLLSSGIELVLLIISSFLVVIVFSIERILTDNKIFIWLMAGAFILLSLLFIPGIRKKIFGLFDQSEIVISRIVFMKWILIYVFTRIIGGSMLFFAIRIFYYIPFSSFTSVIGFHSLIALVSIFFFVMPTNFGITEVGISLLLSTIMPSSFSVIVAVANRLLVIILDICNGGFFWFLFRNIPLQLTKKKY